MRQRESRPYERRIHELELCIVGECVPGNVSISDALIERTDTTIFVTASYDATVDPLGSIVLQAREHDNV